MKKILSSMCMALFIGFMSSCGTDNVSDKVYNQGINLIPAPISLQQQDGKFTLTSGTTFKASTPEAKTVAEFFLCDSHTHTLSILANNDVISSTLNVI